MELGTLKAKVLEANDEVA